MANDIEAALDQLEAEDRNAKSGRALARSVRFAREKSGDARVAAEKALSAVHGGAVSSIDEVAALGRMAQDAWLGDGRRALDYVTEVAEARTVAEVVQAQMAYARAQAAVNVERCKVGLAAVSEAASAAKNVVTRAAAARRG